uniref:Uncharacterized protein n=1 Tax=Plectus sambesii TaxID=2011161 RepID=A0A914X098_9BILA
MTEKVRRFAWRSTVEDVLTGVDLTGKTVLITGTNSGIGSITAQSLALHGAHVVMANRNIPASEKLRQEIRFMTPNAKVDILSIDLSSLKTVKAAAEEFLSKGWPLHILILNAGVYKPAKTVTEDGLEMTFGVNHVAHFYLTEQLLPKLKASAPSRVVIVASHGHIYTKIKTSLSTEEKIKILAPAAGTKDWAPFGLYSCSKLCNILFAFALHRRVHESGVNVYALHPGVIKTELLRDYGFLGKIGFFFSSPFLKSLEQGAATTVYCASSTDLNNISGRYFASCWDAEKRLHTELARDEALQDALWIHTENLLRNYESQ